MRTPKYIAFLALVSFISAQTVGFDIITSPTQDQDVAAGSTLNIAWEAAPSGYDDDTVTITILQGTTASTLQVGSVIASSIINSRGKYIWTVPSTPEFATYALKISLDSDPTIFQYSFPFHITGSLTTSSKSPVPTTTQTQTAGSATPISKSSTVTSASTQELPSSSSTVTSKATSTSAVSSSAKVSSTTTANPTDGASKSTSIGSTLSLTETSSTSTSTSTANPTAALTTITPQPHSGLSTGAKAGIGIGATLGALILLGLIAFAFWYGVRFASKKNRPETSDVNGKAELGPGTPVRAEMAAEPLDDEEKAELERRRRAAELEGGVVLSPVEMGAGGRAELEARRKVAKELAELG